MSGGIVNPFVNILNNVTASNPNKDQNLIEEIIIKGKAKVKMQDAILPDGGDAPDYPTDGDEIRLNNYDQTYTTGETKARLYKFGDPLTLNFKMIVDYERKAGLLASEFDKNGKENPDSALAYLFRIGDTKRYEMLKHWIQVFKSLIKDFDFLFLDVDGLEVVQTKPNSEFFLDKEKVKITFRETTDMLIQSIITTYNHICYDKVRKVSVLPSNLRKFDCYFVVFSAGYYNIIFHDIDHQTKAMDSKVLPTKRKLSDEVFSINTIGDFNHTLYEFVSCSIDPESGSMFTENLGNEMSSDFVKNNITFTYKFATASGTFNNIMGDENWYSILAQAAAENKVQNLARLTYSKNIPGGWNDKLGGSKFVADGKNMFSKENLQSILGNTVINTKLLNDVKSFGNKDTWKGIFKDVKGKTMTNLEDKLVNQLPTKLLGPHSVIGQTLSKLNPDYVKNMIQNTADLGINKIQDMYDGGVATVNNLLLSNYNDNLVDVYNNVFAGYKPKNKLEVIEQKESKPYFDSNPENSFTDIPTYVRPINPTFANSPNKFVKGTNGLSFFDNDNDVNKTGKESINIYERKGF